MLRKLRMTGSQGTSAALRNAAIGVAVIAALSIGTGAARAQKIYNGETGGAGGSPHAVFVTFSKMAKRVGIPIQVNAGKTLTRSMLAAAKNKLDFFSGVPIAYSFMKKRARMYKKVKNAPELAKNIRGIFGFKAGVYHFVAFADSGIKSLGDIKGKRVFVGPPSGAASSTVHSIIRIVTGFAPNKEYSSVKLSWGGGVQAMRDKKVDVLSRPAPVGSAIIQQFGLNNRFRLLNLPEKAVSSPEMRNILRRPDRQLATIAPNTYKGQINQRGVTALAFLQFVGTQVKVPAEAVYKATKSFWENLDEVHAAASFLKGVTPKTAFVGLNAPLHIGAYKYYQEAKIKVPASLLPPEVK
jgi:uncharacterized protein